MIALSVNLNKVALLRNSRDGTTPSVTAAAMTVIDAGVQGITVHPRPDQRHIRPGDVADLAQLLGTVTKHDDRPNLPRSIEFNIEGNPFAGPRDNGYPGFDALIRSARPQQATLVPDSDQQLTSDHGWDLSGDTGSLRACIQRYQANGARVSLFMDPDPVQIQRARDIGADRIELYTGPFAHQVANLDPDSKEARKALEPFQQAAALAQSLGLGINAGHDLNLHNLGLFAQISSLAEVSIGHAVIADALNLGLKTTIHAYLNILASAQ